MALRTVAPDSPTVQHSLRRIDGVDPHAHHLCQTSTSHRVRLHVAKRGPYRPRLSACENGLPKQPVWKLPQRPKDLVKIALRCTLEAWIGLADLLRPHHRAPHVCPWPSWHWRVCLAESPAAGWWAHLVLVRSGSAPERDENARRTWWSLTLMLVLAHMHPSAMEWIGADVIRPRPRFAPAEGFVGCVAEVEGI